MANIPSDLMVKVLDRGPTRSTIPVSEDGAIVRVKRAVVTIPASAGAGVLLPLFRVSAFDRVVALYIANTADLGMTDLDVSVFAGDANGQTSSGNWNQADQTEITGGNGILLNGWDANAATDGHVDMYGVGTGTGFPALQTKPLWELCAVTRPMPGTSYDIVARSNNDPAGSTQSWVLVYTSDN